MDETTGAVRSLANQTGFLTDAVRGYEIFEKKQDGCLRTVLHPA